jgi:hypothetical protein
MQICKSTTAPLEGKAGTVGGANPAKPDDDWKDVRFYACG